MRHIIEHFEGYVTEVEEDTFWGEYEDISGQREIAEFITDKVLLTEEDREFLTEDAYFDLIFYNDDTVEFSFIKEYWTQKELDDALERAKEFIKFFKELPQDV